MASASSYNQQHKPKTPHMCNGKRYFKLVAIPVNDANLTAFNWGTDATLAAAKILAIEAFSANDFLKGPGNKTVSNATAFSKAFLNIRSKQSNEEVLAAIPLERLRSANNAGEAFRTCELEINPSDCNIQVGDSTGLVAGEWFFIGVHYTK